MIQKSWVKLIKSLQIKKYRKEHKLFTAEGAKNITELLDNGAFQIKKLFVTEDFSKKINSTIPFDLITTSELKKISTFQSNNTGLAVFEMLPNLPIDVAKGELVLALDHLQDPGNLGTIVRICDWYGIEKLICSEDTVDLYNPKTVSATMGSLGRVQVFYTDLEDFLTRSKVTVYGAVLGGQSIRTLAQKSSGIIVIGNESNGISPKIMSCLDQKITIPRYGHAESLNAGIATAVILDNFRSLGEL